MSQILKQNIFFLLTKQLKINPNCSTTCTFTLLWLLFLLIMYIPLWTILFSLDKKRSVFLSTSFKNEYNPYHYLWLLMNYGVDSFFAMFIDKIWNNFRAFIKKDTSNLNTISNTRNMGGCFSVSFFNKTLLVNWVLVQISKGNKRKTSGRNQVKVAEFILENMCCVREKIQIRKWNLNNTAWKKYQ